MESLSFSDVVNRVQGDAKEGSCLLIDLAQEKEALVKQILELEDNLGRLNGRLSSVKEAAKNTLKHLNKKMPLAVLRNDFIVVVTDTKDVISIERNVL